MAQQANKSPLLQSCLDPVNTDGYMPQCPLCLTHRDNNNWSQVPANTTSLWEKLLKAAEVIQKSESRSVSFKD